MRVCACVFILYVMVFGFSPDFIQIVYNVVGSLVYTEQWVTMMAIVMVMGMVLILLL